MRAARTLALLTTATLATGTLAACGGGGPDALDEAAAEKVLLTQDEFPLDGYTRSEVTKGVTKDAEGYDGPSLEDVDGDCKKALEEFGTLKMSEYLSSSATVPFTGKDATLVQVQVSGTKKEPQKVVEVTRALGTCGTFTEDQSGVKVTTEFEEFEKDGVQGVRMRSKTGGQNSEFWMGGRAVGDNLVYVGGNGLSEDDFAQVVNEQVKKIEDEG